MMDWMQIIVPVVTAFAGALSGWVFGRRYARAQAISVEIDNLRKVIEEWRELYEEIKKENK